MTLRWALERMRSLEARNAELQKRFEETRAALLARKTMKGREEECATERESYYGKVEALLSQFCEGTLDLKALLVRESGLDQREKSLRFRADELEKEYARRLETLERGFKKLQAETELRTREQNEKAQSDLEQSKSAMDRSFVSREVALKSLERLLAARDKDLSEREARLEDLYRRHKEENERELQLLREDLLSEYQRKTAARERERAEADARREQDWLAEKGRLLAAAARWEAQAREYLEKAAALEAERAELSQANMRRALDFEEKSRSLEAEALRLEGELRAQQALVNANLDKRREELAELERIVVRRFAEADENDGRRETAWKEQEESLRQRTKDWHGRMFEAASASLEKVQQLEALKQELVETIRSYQKKLDGLPGRETTP
ncbi:MAG TPA: hypothetical protein DCM05_11520 [Elusimicrobia bacterium]|nr:hypothetical protein [Elusimicrobiota bacterium]